MTCLVLSVKSGLYVLLSFDIPFALIMTITFGLNYPSDYLFDLLGYSISLKLKNFNSLFHFIPLAFDCSVTEGDLN